MNKKKYPALIIAFLALFIAGCAKAPEWTGESAISIESSDSGAGETYIVIVTIGVANDSTSRAFGNIQGLVNLKIDSSQILSLPFSSVMLLPFERGIMDAETEVDSDTALKLIDLLGIGREKFLEENRIKDFYISKDHVDVIVEKYDRTDIIKLLREKSK